MTLSTLIAKLEEGSGGDRELDGRIAVALGIVIMHERDGEYAFFEAPLEKGKWAFLSGCKRGEDEAYKSLGQCIKTPPYYTSSIDAALSLVEAKLPGCNGSINFGEPHRNPFVQLSPLRADGRHPVNGAAATIPRAILIALLKALQT